MLLVVLLLARTDVHSEALRSVTIGELLVPTRERTSARRREPARVRGAEPQIDLVRLRRAFNLLASASMRSCSSGGGSMTLYSK